jgi:uncharacterized alkaline shock family protein YloU
MKIGTRFVFTVLMILIIGACGVIIAAAFGFISPETVLDVVNAFLNTDYKYFWVGGAALIALVAFCLIFFRKNRKAEKKNPVAERVILDETEAGGISVSVEAIKESAANYLKTLNGVTVQNIEIRPIEGRSATGALSLSVRQDISIPAITAKITSEIREHVQLYTGVELQQVFINILPQKTTTPSK